MTILFLEQLLDGVIRAGKFYVYFTLAGRAWLIAKCKGIDCFYYKVRIGREKKPLKVSVIQ